MAGPLVWSYGVTTVPGRRADLLPRTLTSLKAGGFDAPRLFFDQCSNSKAAEYEAELRLPVTARGREGVRTFGNLVLSLWELYLRAPTADRFALFQDDFVTVRNLRAYLDRTPYPNRGYLNLYTFRENDPDVAAAHNVEVRVPKAAGWCGGYRPGFFKTTQKGRGAVALVFDQAALMALLGSQHMIDRPHDPVRGHRAVDGGVVTGLNKAGFDEYCHWPSLVQHTGDVSSMGSAPHTKAASFPGEEADALQWLPG